jgi:hypothetical protein
MKNIIIIALCMILPVSSYAASSYSLKSSELSKQTVAGKSILCGLIGSKWQVVKKSGKKYVVDSKATSAQKKTCSGLLAKGKASSLSKLPSTSSLAKSNSQSSILSAVSGTPPLLTSIPNTDITNLFWKSGVISAINSGTPTAEQCMDLFGGTTDGASSGFSGCYSAQSVGFSFENILTSGTSLCYMKNFPTTANLAAGAVEVVNGNLPSGGISSIFSVQKGTGNYVVKVAVGGEESNANGDQNGDQSGASTLFLKVDKESTLAKNGDQYRVRLLFCDDPNSTTTKSSQLIRVKLNGEITMSEVNVNGGSKSINSVKAFLKQSGGALEFDKSKSRIANVSWSSGSDDNKMKSYVEISKDDIIAVKSIDAFQGSTRKSASFSHFSGAGMSDLRFDQATYKDQSDNGSFSTIVEYRDPNYLASSSAVTADGVDMVELLDKIDLSTDSFYTEGLTEVDGEEFDCTITPDVELALDMSNAAMLSVREECEGERLDGMNFCSSNELNQAMDNYRNYCMGNNN